MRRIIFLLFVICSLVFLNSCSPLQSSRSQKSLSQDLQLTISSEPSGADIYSIRSDGVTRDIGVTPCKLLFHYSVEKDGSGYGHSGPGIKMKRLGEETIGSEIGIFLDCFIAKKGYYCQKLTERIAVIPQKPTIEQVPSELSYHLNLLPTQSDTTVLTQAPEGSKVFVNGVFSGNSPVNLPLTTGVHIIEIRKR